MINVLKLERHTGKTNKNYYDFILQPNFWFGYDTTTNQKIATSGWESNGGVAIYYLYNNEWRLNWVDESETEFEIKDIIKLMPDDLEEKMSFNEWFKNNSAYEWDTYINYDSVRKEIDNAFDDYLYNGLPHFVINIMKKL